MMGEILKMEKRYQVFVSSTFEDLQLERQAVMQSLLKLGCIPAGMEFFPASNDIKWDFIKKIIDASDYYILILGGRYGSIGRGGISYTEKEYRYAIEQKKPNIAFIHYNPDALPVTKTERGEKGQSKFKIFRDLVMKKMSAKWTSPENLEACVTVGMIELMASYPAIGWIRANDKSSQDKNISNYNQTSNNIQSLKEKIERYRIFLRNAKNNNIHEFNNGNTQDNYLNEFDKLLNELTHSEREQLFSHENSSIIWDDAVCASRIAAWSLGSKLFDLYSKFNIDDSEGYFRKGVCLANLSYDRNIVTHALRSFNDALLFSPNNIDQNRRSRYLSYRAAMQKRLANYDKALDDLNNAKIFASNMHESNDIKYNFCCVFALINDKNSLISTIDSMFSCAPELARIKKNMGRYFSSFSNDPEFKAALTSLEKRINNGVLT